MGLGGVYRIPACPSRSRQPADSRRHSRACTFAFPPATLEPSGVLAGNPDWRAKFSATSRSLQKVETLFTYTCSAKAGAWSLRRRRTKNQITQFSHLHCLSPTSYAMLQFESANHSVSYTSSARAGRHRHNVFFSQERFFARCLSYQRNADGCG